MTKKQKDFLTEFIKIYYELDLKEKEMICFLSHQKKKKKLITLTGKVDHLILVEMHTTYLHRANISCANLKTNCGTGSISPEGIICSHRAAWEGGTAPSLEQLFLTSLSLIEKSTFTKIWHAKCFIGCFNSISCSSFYLWLENSEDQIWFQERNLKERWGPRERQLNNPWYNVEHVVRRMNEQMNKGMRG